MTKQEFILNQQLPYFTDPNTCGFENGLCWNITTDGRKCVFGKNLIDCVDGVTPVSLDDTQSILIEESRGILTTVQWAYMRNIHDNLAKGEYGLCLSYIESLEISAEVDLTELKQLLWNLNT